MRDLLEPLHRIHEELEVECPQEPQGGVLQCDQAHGVIGKGGVVPGAGIEVAEDQSTGELPQVGGQDIDGTPQEEVCPQRLETAVETLQPQERPQAIGEEGPDGGITLKGPVSRGNELPESSKHHLHEHAVHSPEEQPEGPGQHGCLHKLFATSEDPSAGVLGSCRVVRRQ